MKLTKKQLINIIKEEIQIVAQEAEVANPAAELPAPLAAVGGEAAETEPTQEKQQLVMVRKGAELTTWSDPGTYAAALSALLTSSKVKDTVRKSALISLLGPLGDRVHLALRDKT